MANYINLVAKFCWPTHSQLIMFCHLTLWYKAEKSENKTRTEAEKHTGALMRDWLCSFCRWTIPSEFHGSFLYAELLCLSPGRQSWDYNSTEMLWWLHKPQRREPWRLALKTPSWNLCVLHCCLLLVLMRVEYFHAKQCLFPLQDLIWHKCCQLHRWSESQATPGSPCAAFLYIDIVCRSDMITVQNLFKYQTDLKLSTAASEMPQSIRTKVRRNRLESPQEASAFLTDVIQLTLPTVHFCPSATTGCGCELSCSWHGCKTFIKLPPISKVLSSVAQPSGVWSNFQTRLCFSVYYYTMSRRRYALWYIHWITAIIWELERKLQEEPYIHEMLTLWDLRSLIQFLDLSCTSWWYVNTSQT